MFGLGWSSQFLLGCRGPLLLTQVPRSFVEWGPFSQLGQDPLYVVGGRGAGPDV